MAVILLIDDDNALRNLVAEQLSEAGHTILEANAGATGIDLARQHIPDLILCDVTMPGLSGYDVFEELKKDETTQTIPFMFLTGNSERSAVRRGMELGADDYLTKPFTAEELENAVQARLSRRKAINAQSQRKVDDFRSNLALALPHELRTPLTVAYGYTNLLLEEADQLAPDHAAMVHALGQGVSRLYQLSERVLLYTELAFIRESTDFEVRLPVEHPAASVSRVLNDLMERTQRKADVETTIEATRLNIDESHFNVLIRELVDNALKFSKAGTPVKISIATENGKHVIAVSDQGRGMAPWQIAEIDAFVQFDRKLFEQQGAGLGLALVKRIASLVGGELTINSKPGEGTTVQVTIPNTTEP